MTNFYIVAPLSALSKRTRLFKLASYVFAERPQFKVTHIGWEREPGERVEEYLSDKEIGKDIILQGGGYGGNGIRLYYLKWAWRVFFRSLRFEKDAKVWALGLETALPVMLAGKVRGFDVVFDDADRLSMLFKFPFGLNKFIDKVEALVSRRVGAHVIPGVERYPYSSSKFFVVKNLPSHQQLEKARVIFQSREWPRAKFVLNVNGWLGAGRGIDKVLALSKAMVGESFLIILAGKADCAAANELISRDNVAYLGVVNNSEALASYMASDFVFTYYDPRFLINRLAESNKWGDAIKTGVGIIVNREVRTAQGLVDQNIAISIPYDDVSALIKEVTRLCREGSCDSYKKAANQMSIRLGSFEEQISPLFGEGL